ncbi:sigma-70 family RNA polymerase sigma factor [Rhizobium sp. S96]|uniref:sigma-70 family RNA polymerase sigma factor n=1 Tax=Rhizobium sp. S96 TaxID=3055140 RepID=UPI0025AA51E6|nr:sigma-70 family RNA polymerase sigma factor [Rhizobium sp. S96]MDM9622678.1 sigma-70 family RNA polymerase sigma factor [Rhizobium sp. S96]
MTDQEFEDSLQALRPRLHRYCARITGSVLDGEDAVQDTLVKALRAHREGTEVDNLEVWLLRIAHNTCIDHLRRGRRQVVVPLTDDIEDRPMPEADVLAVGFRTFLQLPELQRCAVILKDVLGHSVEEVAEIADCTPAAAKSALQRGRKMLKYLAEMPGDVRLPLLSEADLRKMRAYVQLFQRGDFDAIRALLADDVKLDLVNRLKLEGREKIGVYFTRYAAESKWRFSNGVVDGHPVMLVFDSTEPSHPSHFVVIDWRGGEIAAIRDFLFAPYATETTHWGQTA